MKGFGIYVKNNLLDPKHYSKMGQAIWLYLFLLDRMTSISEKGIGKILGGRPIKFESDVEPTFGVNEKTYRRWIKILEDAGYINVTRAPYGLVISVNKAEKIFGNRADKNVRTRKGRERTKMSEHKDKNVRSNKTIQLDNTNITASEASRPFSWDEYLKKMDENKDEAIQLIAYYFRQVKWRANSPPEAQVAIKRHVRAARDVVKFEKEKVLLAIDECRKKYRDIGWTLETVLKQLTK